VAKKNTNFANLIAIISVASIASIGAMVNNLTARIPELNSIARNNATPVKGYTRPDKNPFKEENSGEIPEGVSLPDELSGKKVSLDRQQLDDVRRRFEQVVVLMHAHEYDFAIKALDYILTITTELPQVYVNMGFAYLGLKDFATAESAFGRAIELRADQANAYYGMAIIYEEKKQLEPALGAMRTFVHLADPEDKYVVKARAAIWEWKAMMGRIPGTALAPDGMKPQIKPVKSVHKRASSDSSSRSGTNTDLKPDIKEP